MDSVYGGAGYPKFTIRGRFAGGPVTDHRWTVNGGPEIVWEKLEVVPENLEPGSYRIRLTAKDADGHEVSCETTMTVVAPPPPPKGKSWIKRHWKALVIAGAVACVATAAISYGTTTTIPPCGWFGKEVVRIVVGKPNTPVIPVPY